MIPYKKFKKWFDPNFLPQRWRFWIFLEMVFAYVAGREPIIEFRLLGVLFFLGWFVVTSILIYSTLSTIQQTDPLIYWTELWGAFNCSVFWWLEFGGGFRKIWIWIVVNLGPWV